MTSPLRNEGLRLCKYGPEMDSTQLRETLKCGRGKPEGTRNPYDTPSRSQRCLFTPRLKGSTLMASEDNNIGASRKPRGGSSFRYLLDLSPDQVVVHDMNGRFLYVNDAVFPRHGYSREEFMAMHPWDITVNVNQRAMMANLRAMVLANRPTLKICTVARMARHSPSNPALPASETADGI